ncbi:MAG: methyltransferase domain-containing protein [Gammaproteobacteria bacterium]|nr:methyltransferase domain-containing protein [Gammaproteobacteria bacterium]NIM73836.1 methyltransferase domain-containing protein [Gammaproteobacteria bacterium]NIN39413.1 methyltransferase domain-containing protein [Gammaproteobacteria bacterium]NIO25078.1 methyltransferase domain-containing protein [Gammaproteobacteria bacterium]NIO65710.1 methyltransferase domain-containing protein [Gammaproteobacteria bacterium]
MNLEQARFNMVEQQIRTWEVLDQKVLDIMAEVPREDFVPAAYRNLAFADTCIPLPHGQTMMLPRVEARMLQALQIEPGDRVLEVGTGSGFVTALLARLAAHVTSVEIHDALRRDAEDKLERHGIDNVELFTGDACHGWDQGAPYDVIAVTGSLPVLDERFQASLATGGRLFVIVGQEPAMEALLVTRTGASQWSTESLFETVVPPLIGVDQPERFVL